VDATGDIYTFSYSATGASMSATVVQNATAHYTFLGIGT